jgi:hypothetical protein
MTQGEDDQCGFAHGQILCYEGEMGAIQVIFDSMTKYGALVSPFYDPDDGFFVKRSELQGGSKRSRLERTCFQ